MKKLWENKTLRFLISAVGLYVSWYLLYRLVIQPYTSIDEFVTLNLAHWSDGLLHLFGYESILDTSDTYFIILSIPGSYSFGVQIADSCNGVLMFGLFAMIIVAFPSKLKPGWKFNPYKLWYIPLGILIVHLVNLIRITILTLISSYNPRSLDFNHDVTFKIITYAVIFVLWYIWISKFSGFKKNKTLA